MLSKILGASWRTSALGWLTLISAFATSAIALLDSDPATKPSLEAIIGALIGVGLIAARDNKVTSEQATKPPTPPQA